MDSVETDSCKGAPLHAKGARRKDCLERYKKNNRGKFRVKIMKVRAIVEGRAKGLSLYSSRSDSFSSGSRPKKELFLMIRVQSLISRFPERFWYFQIQWAVSWSLRYLSTEEEQKSPKGNSKSKFRHNHCVRLRDCGNSSLRSTRKRYF